jgi:hypothetical protein
MQNLNYRSIQIGFTAIVTHHYVNDWIVSVDDITEKYKVIHNLILNEKIKEAKLLLPLEKLYPLSNELKYIISHS